MTDLPPGWTMTTVGEAGRVELGMARNPARHHGPNMKPYLRVANVFEDRFDLSDLKYMHFTPAEFERYRVQPGDILLNEGQSPELLGRPALWRNDSGSFAFTNSLIRFQAGRGVLPEWALTVFRHYMHGGRFTQEVRITTNIAHLSASRFSEVEFPVPPLDEQGRILEAIETIRPHIEVGRSILDRITKSLLATHDQIVESALSDADGTPWNVGDLLEIPLSNGKSVQTRRGGFPVLRLTALSGSGVDFDENKEGDWTTEQARPYFVRGGDFLVSRASGSLKLVGRGALAPAPISPIAFPDTIIRIRPKTDRLLPDFLALTWSSASVRRQIESRAKTTAGIYKINQTDIRRIAIPLPTIQTQRTILDRVRQEIDALKEFGMTVKMAAASSGDLERALLREAFSGRLVRQDARDEPALVLLQRIRAERAAAAPARPTRRRSARSPTP